MSYHCWRPYVCLCIDVDYHGGDDDDGGGDDDDDGKIQNGQLIDWGVRIFGKYQATGFFCYKFHPSFKPKFLSSNFPEIILSCAYRASWMQQLRTQPKLRRGSMPYYRGWETRAIQDPRYHQHMELKLWPTLYVIFCLFFRLRIFPL